MYIEAPSKFARWKTAILYQMHCLALYLWEPKRLILPVPETKAPGRSFITEVKIMFKKRNKQTNKINKQKKKHQKKPCKEQIVSARTLKMPASCLNVDFQRLYKFIKLVDVSLVIASLTFAMWAQISLQLTLCFA